MTLATRHPRSFTIPSRLLLLVFLLSLLLLRHLVHAQCRELSRKALVALVNSRPLSLRDRRIIISTARRLLSEINPHRQLHLRKLKTDPLRTLARLQPRLETGSTFAFHRTMISVFASLDDRNTFYTPPPALAKARASLGFWLRPYWDSPTSTSRPKFAVAGPDVKLDRVPSDMPKGSRVFKVDGKDPVQTGLKLAEQGYAATYAHRLWDASFLLSSRQFSEHPFPNTDASKFSYVHPNGTTLSITMPWVFLDCRPDESSSTPVGDTASRELTSDAQLAEEELKHREFPGLFDFREDEGKMRMLREPFMKKQQQNDDLVFEDRAGIEPFYNWSFQSFNLGRDVSWYLVTIHTELGSLYSVVPFTFDIELSDDQKSKIFSLLASLPKDANIALDIRGAGQFTRQSLQTARYLTHLLTGRDFPQVSIHVRASERMGRMTWREGRDGLLRGDGGKAVRRGLQMDERYAAPFGDLFSDTTLATGRPDVAGEEGRVYFGELAIICTTSTTQLFEMMVVWLRDLNVAPYVLSINGRTGGNVVSSVTYTELRSLYPEVWTEDLPEDVGMSTAWNRQFRHGALAGEEVQYFGVRPDVDYKFSFDDIMGSWEGVERAVLRWFNERKPSAE